MRLETETTVFKANSVANAINDAMTAANGKNKVFHQNDPPSSLVGLVAGDTWFDTDDGYSIHRWDGTQWVLERLSSTAIAAGAITASHIDAGAITSDKIAANAITTSKLTVGDLSNLATVNEWDAGSMITHSANLSTMIDDTDTSTGMQYVIKKPKSDNSLSRDLPLASPYTPNIFTAGDEVYYSIKIQGVTSARNVYFRIWAYDASGTYIGYNGDTLSVTTSLQTFSGSVEINNDHMNTGKSWSMAASYVLALREVASSGPYNQLRVQQAVVRKKNSGDVIVGGAIEGSSIRTPIGDGYEVWYVNDKLPNVEYQRAPRDSQITDTYHRLKQEGLQSVDDSDTVRASIISTLLKLYRYDFNSAPIETVYGWYLTGMAYSPRIFTAKGEVATVDPNNPSIKLTLTPETLTHSKSWSTLGGCWRYKVGHRVHVHVALEDLTADTNTQLWTFLQGYRPYDTVIATGRGENGSTFCSLWINSSGVVTVRTTGTKAAVDIEYDAFN